MSERWRWPVEPNQGLRGVDDFGSGAFGADRRTSLHSVGSAPIGTSYGHMGLDIAAVPGTPLLAPTDGFIGGGEFFAYKGAGGDLRSIHFRSADKAYLVTILYVKQTAPRGEVKRGDVIGVVQDVAAFHSTADRKMTNHIHFATYRVVNGVSTLINPETMLEEAA